MKRLIIALALLGLATAAPAGAAPAQSLEGRWTNPKQTMVVQVERCGGALCGKVVKASPKALAKAREGGTRNLVGTRLLSGLKPVGSGRYRGRVFVPRHNLHATATVRQLGRDTMLVTGCALAGVVCDEQRWTRIDG